MFYVTPSLGLRLGLLLLVALALVVSGAQAGIEHWLDRIQQALALMGR